jgi:protein SCO1/2
MTMRFQTVLAACAIAVAIAASPSVAADKIEVGGPFTLTDMDGNRVTEASYRDKVLVAFFGFTHCPAVCPTSLLIISQAFDMLGGDVEGVQGLFITVDPERDTPEVLAGYMANFHPSLTGLTGTAEETAAVTRAYHVYYARAETPDSEAGYLMDHSAAIYVMDQDGDYVRHFGHGADPAEIAEAIEDLL